MRRRGDQDTDRQVVPPRIIAIAGGKGGVGKSVMAANLSIAMAAAGRRVALLDADIGMGNQHTLFGIERPGPGLSGFLAREVEDLDSIAVGTTYPNLILYPCDGSRGVPQINNGQKERLLRHIGRIDADVVLIDLGAGAGLPSLDLFALADIHLLVLTAQVTSIQNAYSFLKTAVYRMVARLAQSHERRQLAEEGWRAVRPPTLPALIAWLRERSPELADIMEPITCRLSVQLLGNFLMDDRDRRVPASIARMIRDQLGLATEVVGLVPASRRVHESVTLRVPILELEPTSGPAREIQRVAARLLAQPLADERPARSSHLLAVGF